MFKISGCIYFHVVQVMVDALGRSKGCGFVAFSTPEEAARAVSVHIYIYIYKDI